MGHGHLSSYMYINQPRIIILSYLIVSEYLALFICKPAQPRINFPLFSCTCSQARNIHDIYTEPNATLTFGYNYQNTRILVPLSLAVNRSIT